MSDLINTAFSEFGDAWRKPWGIFPTLELGVTQTLFDTRRPSRTGRVSEVVNNPLAHLAAIDPATGAITRIHDVDEAVPFHRRADVESAKCGRPRSTDSSASARSH